MQFIEQQVGQVLKSSRFKMHHQSSLVNKTLKTLLKRLLPCSAFRKSFLKALFPLELSIIMIILKRFLQQVKNWPTALEREYISFQFFFGVQLEVERQRLQHEWHWI